MTKEIRWIGPYKETDRHADKITLDHMIWLQNEYNRERMVRDKIEKKYKQSIKESVDLALQNMKTRTELEKAKEALNEIYTYRTPSDEMTKDHFTLGELLDEIAYYKSIARKLIHGI